MMLTEIANCGTEVRMGAVGNMVQVNVRVERSVKERAEEALQLSGGTLSELIKKVVAKVARGGGSCEEVLSAVDDRPLVAGAESPFADSWAAADRLYSDLGIDVAQASSSRDWETVYSEAMNERYRQKGLIS